MSTSRSAGLWRFAQAALLSACALSVLNAADGEASGEVTYSRDIAPIVQANCVACHRPGQSGPFTLLTYEDVSRHALQIAAVTKSRFMPPWKPVPGFGHFRDERRLSDAQIDLVDVWARTGKARGRADDLPPLLEFSDEWQLGRPDIVLEISDGFEVPADGPDIHQMFVFPTGLREHRLVTAVEFQPGRPQVVHHASFYVDVSGGARRLDAADSSVGYLKLAGPGFAVCGTLRSWLPGMTPRRLPAGAGRLLPLGSDLVVEVHYHLSGKPERDHFKIGLHLAPREARQLVTELQILNKQLKIPAGASRHHHHSTYTLPVDTVVYDAAPHMHLLGREMKATATLPGGEVLPLIWIQDWDFNWQGQYVYVEPLQLAKGTRIDVDCWFDNSTNNPLNPNSPPQTVYWGEETSDEMDICHFQVTCKSIADFDALAEHYGAWGERQQIRFRRERKNRGSK